MNEAGHSVFSAFTDMVNLEPTSPGQRAAGIESDDSREATPVQVCAHIKYRLNKLRL